MKMLIPEVQLLESSGVELKIEAKFFLKAGDYKVTPSWISIKVEALSRGSQAPPRPTKVCFNF